MVSDKNSQSLDLIVSNDSKGHYSKIYNIAKKAYGKDIQYAILPLLFLSLLFGCHKDPTPEFRKTINMKSKKQIENEYEDIIYYTTIPGTYDFDIDSMQICATKKYLEKMIDETNTIPTYNPKDLDYGSTLSQSDIFWEQINKEEKTMHAMNGAVFCDIEKDLEELTIKDLVNQDYDIYEIDIQGPANKRVGEVFGVVTRKGKYAAFRIEGYTPLKIKNGSSICQPIDSYNIGLRLKYFKRKN